MEINRSEVLQIIKLSVCANAFSSTEFPSSLLEKLESFLVGPTSSRVNVTMKIDEDKIADFVKEHKQREKSAVSEQYLDQLPSVKCRITSSSFGSSRQRINLGFYCTGATTSLLIDGNQVPCKFVTIERTGNSLVIFEELHGDLIAHVFDFSESPHMDNIKFWATAFKENTSYSVIK